MHITDSIRFHQSLAQGATHDRPKGCFLNFLINKDAVVNNGKQYIASRRIDKLHVMEVKGIFDAEWSFDLLPTTCFWVHCQFVGQSQRNSMAHTILTAGGYQVFYSGRHPANIQVKTGRVSMLLMGVEIDTPKNFTAEWPLLEEPTRNDQPYFSSIHMGYRVKQVLEKMGQCTNSPYTLSTKIHYQLCQLIDVYHQDLHDKIRAQHKEDIVIYHEAIDYIREHYVDEGINRDTIAEHLGISVRKLYRVFENKKITIRSAIQTIRLYRAREILRETNDPVDIVAFKLHFSTAHYFYKQYVQLFGHSPSKERELYKKSKKKK